MTTVIPPVTTTNTSTTVSPVATPVVAPAQQTISMGNGSKTQSIQQPVQDLNSWFASQGQTLPTDVAGRFANPQFAEAARQLGYTPATYQVNANNASVNQQILSKIQTMGGGNNTTGNNIGANGTTQTNGTGGTQTSGDSQLDALNANNSAQSDLQSGLAQAHTQMGNAIQSLMQGNVPYTPAQQQIINVLQSTSQRAIQTAQMATASENAMLRYNLAKTGQTQTSPATAAAQLALSTQAGADAVLDASNQGTLALANYEQQIQSGDIQAARDSFTDYEKYSQDISDSLNKMYDDTSKYNSDMRTYNLAQQNYSLDQQRLSESIKEFGATEGYRYDALSQAALLAQSPTSTLKDVVQTGTDSKGNPIYTPKGTFHWSTWGSPGIDVTQKAIPTSVITPTATDPLALPDLTQ